MEDRRRGKVETLTNSREKRAPSYACYRRGYVCHSRLFLFMIAFFSYCLSCIHNCNEFSHKSISVLFIQNISPFLIGFNTLGYIPEGVICTLQVAGCRLQVARRRLQVAGCRLHVAGCRLGLQVAGQNSEKELNVLNGLQIFPRF